MATACFWSSLSVLSENSIFASSIESFKRGFFSARLISRRYATLEWSAVRTAWRASYIRS